MLLQAELSIHSSITFCFAAMELYTYRHSLIPRPRQAFCRFQLWKSRWGLGTRLSLYMLFCTACGGKLGGAWEQDTDDNRICMIQKPLLLQSQVPGFLCRALCVSVVIQVQQLFCYKLNTLPQKHEIQCSYTRHCKLKHQQVNDSSDMQVKIQWLTVTFCLAALTEHTVHNHHWLVIGLEFAAH